MTTRRLAAILAADVAGFSAMMERDEEGTAARIRALRTDVIEPTLTRHQGRLVKTTGDGFLAEFASPVEAVRAAIAIQDQLASANGVSLRIGINLGDIIIEDDGDVLRDGVNVAARLEQMCDPGRVLISEDVQRQIAGKIDRSFEDRGEQQVKNIARLVRVYALAGVHTSTEPRQKPLALPEKPSIAVLPFTNMSGPDEEYLCDGLVEDITTALSRVRSFFVIARYSSFSYKGRAVDVRQVGRELGVRYVLEGSIRRAAGTLRITGQLVEAQTGHHVWADRFDGTVESVFDLQDRVTESVVAAIQPRLLEAEARLAFSKPTHSLDAYDLYLRALYYRHRHSREDNAAALDFLQRAHVADPEFARAYALSALVLSQQIFQNWTTDQTKTEGEVLRLASLALSKDQDDSEVLWQCAFSMAHAGANLDRCVVLSEKAIALNQNSAQAFIFGGWVQMYAGHYEMGLEQLARGRRLSPFDPITHGCTTGTAGCYLFLERFEEAITWAKRAIAETPTFAAAYRFLGAAMALSGREEEARQVIGTLLSITPNASVSALSKALVRTPKFQVLRDGLIRAGLPE